MKSMAQFKFVFDVPRETFVRHPPVRGDEYVLLMVMGMKPASCT